MSHMDFPNTFHIFASFFFNPMDLNINFPHFNAFYFDVTG
jgi:hypothetical protein